MREAPEAGARGAGFSARGVREHYARLAPQYGPRANSACERAYAGLVRRTLHGRRRVLEIGAGGRSLLHAAGAALGTACDLSLPMLLTQREPLAWTRVVADALALPFRDAAFDGLIAVNLVEHLPDPPRFVREAARVLVAGGRLIAVTPNGGAARLLALLERLRLKLPEGPHRYLNFAELEELAGRDFRVLEHRRFLVCPAGPPAVVSALDALAAGRGLFQYAVLERRNGAWG